MKPVRNTDGQDVTRSRPCPVCRARFTQTATNADGLYQSAVDDPNGVNWIPSKCHICERRALSSERDHDPRKWAPTTRSTNDD